MVVTVFGFGNYVERDPPETPFYGATLNQQYAIHMAFVYIAILLILVMLCTKPCIVKFAGSKQVHEENQIEFQQIPQSINDNDKNAINDNSREASEDMMQRR